MKIIKRLTLEAFQNAIAQAQFVSLNYTNAHDECARYNLQLGTSAERRLEKAIVELELFDVSDIDGHNDLPLEEARMAVLSSFQKSLDALKRGDSNEDYTRAGHVEKIGRDMLRNTTTDTVEIQSVLRSKVVLREGKPRRQVNSRPLTIAKRVVEKHIPHIVKVRSFRFDRIESARIAGVTYVRGIRLPDASPLNVEFKKEAIERIAIHQNRINRIRESWAK